MNVKKLTLYSYWQSSCSWRVRAVLEMKKIPYEYKAVNLSLDEQYQENYSQVNPAEQVPALKLELQDGKTEIFQESMAIINLLEELYPQNSIYPQNPIDRAKVIAIAEMIISGIQPLQNPKVVRKVEEFTNSKEKSAEWKEYWIETKFEKLERLIQPLTGRYTFGDQLTLADFCLVPQVYNAYRFKINMDKFPLLKRLYEFLLKEEVIEKSKPANMLDKPNE